MAGREDQGSPAIEGDRGSPIEEHTELIDSKFDLGEPISASTEAYQDRNEISLAQEMSVAQELSEKRLRTLTFKAAEQFEEKVVYYSRKCAHFLRDLDCVLSVDYRTIPDIESGRKHIHELFAKYTEASDEFIAYLDRERSDSSLRERSSHIYVRDATKSKVLFILKHLENVESRIHKELVSHKAESVKEDKFKTAGSTSSGSVSSKIANQRMKVAAKKAQLQFELKEAELKREQARLEEEEAKSRAVTERKKSELRIDMDILASEREAVVAEHELTVIQEEQLSECDSLSKVSEKLVSQRTQQFVSEQNSILSETRNSMITHDFQKRVHSPTQSGQGNRSQHVEHNAADKHSQLGDSHVLQHVENYAVYECTQQGQGQLSQQVEHNAADKYSQLSISHVSQHAKHYAAGESSQKGQGQLPQHVKHYAADKHNQLSQGYVPQHVEHYAAGESTQGGQGNTSKHVDQYGAGKYSQASQGHISQHAKYSAAYQSTPLSYGNMSHDVEHVTGHALQPSQGHALQNAHAPFPVNPVAPPFRPQEFQTQCLDFSRFLLRKDLIMSRLAQFDDLPENYISWKSSFLGIMKEVGANSAEELELLVKWLGPKSTRHAKSIKSSIAGNPSRGCSEIWKRLDEQYGSPEVVESSLKKKLDNFPRLTAKDYEKLYDLVDLISEILTVKKNSKFSGVLSYYDSSLGTNQVVSKLPPRLQSKWTDRAAAYKKSHDHAYPPFEYFADFLKEMSSVLNDPGLTIAVPDNNAGNSRRGNNFRREDVKVTKTDLKGEQVSGIMQVPAGLKCISCSGNPNHTLNKCRKFKEKTLSERRGLLKEHRICYRCCNSSSHIYKNCRENVSCYICHSKQHPSALHPSHKAEHTGGSGQQTPKPPHGEETRAKSEGSTEVKENDDKSSVITHCTRICGKGFSGRSCAKTLLVKLHPVGELDKSIAVYAILDDQSNRTLGRSDIFSYWDIPKTNSEPYTMVSCAGRQLAAGRRLTGLAVTSYDGMHTMNLPTIIECNQIPNNREEIPPPQVSTLYPHMKDVCLPALREDIEVQLLIGRDLPEAFHVTDQRIRGSSDPFAQRLKLGWVIVGEVCLGKTHKPSDVSVMKTRVLADGRTTLFEECPSKIHVKESPDLCKDVFLRTTEDEKQGFSREDRDFIEIMDKEFTRNPDGSWSAPLPFRQPHSRLPNNQPLALKRARMLDANLKKDHTKREHMLAFMKDIIDRGHAEVALPIEDDRERWYLPLFGVYHPKKPGKIRGVFDSSAKYQDVSLNEVLMKGPDLTNSLLGVLLRFRKEKVAVTGDIQQMFYCFSVIPEHRDFLRFYWYEANDPSRPMIEYRMTKHVFGNCPSPAVASYGLRRTAREAEDDYGTDVVEFVESNFYVDDGLISVSTPEEAVDLISRTQSALSTGGIRLHKISSNSQDVINSFPSEDLAQELKDLDLGSDSLPSQRSLGLCWNLESDTFSFKASKESKAYTRRGVLSTINSLYDPLGFLAPVTIQGKTLLRKMVEGTVDWDEPLSSGQRDEWEAWEKSLQELGNLQIPRRTPISEDDISNKVHVYADASERAIAAVAYLQTVDADGTVHVSFLLGKSKVAPKHGHSIPRLELCASLLAVEVAEILAEQMSIPPENMIFYSDSKVVLGYLKNRTRRFYIYVANRVSRILRFTRPEQWFYVESENNPADQGTRFLSASMLKDSTWILGGAQLIKSHVPTEESFPLVEPSEDKEIRPEAVIMKTEVIPTPVTYLLSKFSRWSKLVKVLSHVIYAVGRFKQGIKKEPGMPLDPRSPESLKVAEKCIIKEVQKQFYSIELDSLHQGKPIPRTSSVLTLCPKLDEEGILRVGGRLSMSNVEEHRKHPILIPGSHHIATLLTRHFHESVFHQGRHFTEGAVREAGYWITGGKRLVSLIIHRCVTCRRLRSRLCIQKMADLPTDRVTPTPPFSCVGVDVFGPWEVITRRTRGGAAANKRWAALFTCMSSRAVHIEVLEEMSSSCFINAVRRLYSLRGRVKQFRSDKGTNFIGATADIGVSVVESKEMKDFLSAHGSTWTFNPPHASHFGGVWERMIGVARRILDAMLLENKGKELTHEVLTTFMAEVCAIINARPLVPVSSDPEQPFILSPSVLLTQKTEDPVESFDYLDVRDMYRAQWRHVQVLAEKFWSRWKQEYLLLLQPRRKWQGEEQNVKVGDVVLMKDAQSARNDWPLGIITRTIPSEDGLVRKVELRVSRNGKSTSFQRPVTEIVMLVTNE